MKATLFSATICLILMFGLKLSGKLTHENLELESENIVAKALPLDMATVDKPYETATFGIG